MAFEWDLYKNISNKLKHGISFETASLIFNDPYLISVPEQQNDRNDERWRSVGLVDGVAIFVAHTWRLKYGEETIRIISARAATPGEEEQYFIRRYGKKRTEKSKKTSH